MSLTVPPHMALVMLSSRVLPWLPWQPSPDAVVEEIRPFEIWLLPASAPPTPLPIQPDPELQHEEPPCFQTRRAPVPVFACAAACAGPLPGPSSPAFGNALSSLLRPADGTPASPALAAITCTALAPCANVQPGLHRRSHASGDSLIKVISLAGKTVQASNLVSLRSA